MKLYKNQCGEYYLYHLHWKDGHEYDHPCAFTRLGGPCPAFIWKFEEGYVEFEIYSNGKMKQITHLDKAYALPFTLDPFDAKEVKRIKALIKFPETNPNVIWNKDRSERWAFFYNTILRKKFSVRISKENVSEGFITLKLKEVDSELLQKGVRHCEASEITFSDRVKIS